MIMYVKMLIMCNLGNDTVLCPLAVMIRMTK